MRGILKFYCFQGVIISNFLALKNTRKALYRTFYFEVGIWTRNLQSFTNSQSRQWLGGASGPRPGRIILGKRPSVPADVTLSGL
jgi:hypothetical protein